MLNRGRKNQIRIHRKHSRQHNHTHQKIKKTRKLINPIRLTTIKILKFKQSRNPRQHKQKPSPNPARKPRKRKHRNQIHRNHPRFRRPPHPPKRNLQRIRKHRRKTPAQKSRLRNRTSNLRRNHPKNRNQETSNNLQKY